MFEKIILTIKINVRMVYTELLGTVEMQIIWRQEFHTVTK